MKKTILSLVAVIITATVFSQASFYDAYKLKARQSIELNGKIITSISDLPDSNKSSNKLITERAAKLYALKPFTESPILFNKISSKYHNIYFGNSITYGVGTSDTAYRYSTRLSSRMGVEEINRGYSGSMLVDTLFNSNAFETRFIAQMPLYDSNYYRFMFISYGTNDIIYYRDTTHFKRVYQKILDTAFARGWNSSNLVLVTPGFLYFSDSSTARNLDYVNAVKTVGQTNNLTTVDIYTEFKRQFLLDFDGTSRLMPDGVHPSDKGAAIWDSLIWEGVKNKITFDNLNVLAYDQTNKSTYFLSPQKLKQWLSDATGGGGGYALKDGSNATSGSSWDINVSNSNALGGIPYGNSGVGTTPSSALAYGDGSWKYYSNSDYATWLSSYFPSTTGTRASGTWGIDISGTAANASSLGAIAYGGNGSGYSISSSLAYSGGQWRYHGSSDYASWLSTYFPSTTGTRASGTWGIDISGNAATASNASSLGGISYGGNGSGSTPSSLLGYGGSWKYYGLNEIKSWLNINTTSIPVKPIRSKLLTTLEAASIIVADTSYSDGFFRSYRVGGMVNITAIATNAIKLRVTWTDETGNIKTQDLSNTLSSVGVTALPSINFVTYPNTPIIIESIVVTSGGSIEYNAHAIIEDLGVLSGLD